MMHHDTSCSNINRPSTTTYTHFCSSQVMLVVIQWRKTNLQLSKSARPFEVHFIFTGLSRPHGEHWGPLESNCITDTSPQWLAHRHDNCRGLLTIQWEDDKDEATGRERQWVTGQAQLQQIFHTFSVWPTDIKYIPAISAANVTFNPPWISLFSCCHFLYLFYFIYLFAHPRLDLCVTGRV